MQKCDQGLHNHLFLVSHISYHNYLLILFNILFFFFWQEKLSSFFASGIKWKLDGMIQLRASSFFSRIQIYTHHHSSIWWSIDIRLVPLLVSIVYQQFFFLPLVSNSTMIILSSLWQLVWREKMRKNTD